MPAYFNVLVSKRKGEINRKKRPDVVSNSTHDKWYTLLASTVPYSLVLTKQPRLYFMNTTLPLYQLKKQAANATLCWFLCPAKQKVSFVSHSTKRCHWEKCFLYIHYFSKMKSNPAKKTTEQYFSGKTKPTCQNSAIFEHFQKWPKNLGDVLAHGLSIIIWPIGHHNIKGNILKICLLCFFFYCTLSESLIEAQERSLWYRKAYLSFLFLKCCHLAPPVPLSKKIWRPAVDHRMIKQSYNCTLTINNAFIINTLKWHLHVLVFWFLPLLQGYYQKIVDL